MQSVSPKRLEHRLQPVRELLRRQELVEQLIDRDEHDRNSLGADLLHRQHHQELRRKLSRLHPADVAHLVEMLPPDERLAVWSCVPAAMAGVILAEVNDPVAEGLISETADQRLLSICQAMDPDDLGFIDDMLPASIREELVGGLRERDRSWHETTVTYPEDSIGYLMSRDMLFIEAEATVRDTLKYLRSLDDFPDQTDQIFVVDSRRHLLGTLQLKDLFLNPVKTPIQELAEPAPEVFQPEQNASEAAHAFERYDLISAPVVDDRDRLLGRLTVDVVMDFIRNEAEEDAFLREGLSADEDLFGPVIQSARSRWMWLSLNLMTAFLASRVIGLFEGSIEKLVALATLMPIVASIGGNTGNQTIALVVRGLALKQINRENLRYLALKELGIALINGLVWGAAMGAVAWLLYDNLRLGLVMAAATLCNLLVAALFGIFVPVVRERLGRDPALGSSVVLTFITDSMGFFIFLGMATLVLKP
ncbi:MAG: magnesium transporter [Gammaproteobacteria bacterium]